VTVSLKPLERASRNARRAPRHAAPVTRTAPAAYAGALILIALLVPLHRWWAVQVLLVPALLVVPGLILLRALRVPGRAVGSFPVYVPCASIVVLFGSGLAVDLIGPLLGVKEPIRTGPLLLGLAVICLGLLATSIDAPPDVEIQWSSAFAKPARLVWPLVIPLIAAAGALRLNSGHGNGLALTALFACAAIIGTGFIFYSRFSNTLLAVILYAAELTTMWSYSLRGDLVYGFDIATEYYDLNRTVLTGIWHTTHSGDAYGAMLSVTVFPAELHFLSGVPTLLVLKLVYPAISSLLPLGVFGLARRILSRRWAFAAAAFIVMQPSFAQEIPAAARQEVALVLFGALIMAMLDRRLPRRSQLALVALLSLAMVMSHYSTTYVAVLLLLFTLLMQFAVSWFRKLPHVTGAVSVTFLVSLAGAVLWYGPVTHSAAHLDQVAQTVDATGLNFLPNQAAGGGSLSAYLQGNTETPISATRYEQLVAIEYTNNDPFIVSLFGADSKVYSLRDSPASAPPVKLKPVHSALSLGSVVSQQLIYLLAAFGALLMVLRRKSSVTTRYIGLLALAALFFLVLIRLSGTLAAVYNQERALLQAMMILAIPVCWSLQRLSGWRKRRRSFVLAAAAASLTLMFIGTSGILGAVLGGGTTTNLANSGEDFERFYMTAPELASARWLGQSVRPGQLVYADRYAQLPLIAMTGITGALFNDVTPRTIDQYAWVYASTSNIVDHRARALFNGQDSVTYVFPAGFLDANYDLVFTDGSSEVFHR
jgi:uncharacterized membrane protein